MLEIFLWKGSFLFKGNEFCGQYHRHIPIQIIASFNERVAVSAAGGLEVAANALAIAGNVEHVCRNHGASISLFVDPETEDGKAVKRILSGDRVATFPIERLEGLRDEFESFRKAEEPEFSRAEGIARPVSTGDSRIGSLLDLIPSIPDKKAPVGALAARVGISETRLMHLFKDEMGIPIRRYLLWKRLLDAIFLIKRGQALTMAAVEAGFADYAHFSRTFKGMFGAKVEDIFKNDRFVQAYVREK
jgi:AraC-like DNA-binding protein